jgi:putative transposase
VHLVIVTKWRGVLDGAMLTRYGHARLLADYPPKVAVSALMSSPQGRLGPPAPQCIHRARNPRVHAWALLVPSYFAASCGGAPLSIIRQYIEQQQRPA